MPNNSQSKKLSSKIKVLEGAEGNLPDHASMKAAQQIKDKVSSMTSNDVLFCLITGGGSALLPLPAHPITLEEKCSLIKKLSHNGASINELNIVRIAISQVKGGKRAECGRNAQKIISLIISDIINDPLDLIASGPTIQYKPTKVTPREILEKYKLVDSLPNSIAKVIQKSENNAALVSTAKNNSQVFLIGSNRQAIEAAMNEAKKFNLYSILLSVEVQGNVDVISEAFFNLARAMRSSSLSREEFKRSLEILHAQPNFEKELYEALEANHHGGICIVSGGETTVKVTGDGRGGRNQELALRFSKLCLDSKVSDDTLFLSSGTDGIDGNCDAAGAIGGSKIFENIPGHAGCDIRTIMEDFILRNDSYSFYKNFLGKHTGDYHIMTGQTGTNVMDIHLLIVPNTKLSKL